MKFSVGRESSLVVGLSLRILDMLAIMGTSRLAYNWYFDSWAIPDHYILAYVASAITLAAIFPSFGLYHLHRGGSKTQELFQSFLAVSGLFVALALIAVISKTNSMFSRVWFFEWYLLSVVVIASYRLVTRLVLNEARRRGFNRRKVALVGDAKQLSRVNKVLQNSTWLGLNVAGAYLLPNEEASSKQAGVKLLGEASNLAQQVMENPVDEIWLCLPMNRAQELETLLNDLSRSAATIRYVPDIFGFDLINHSVSQVGELPVVNLSVSPIQGWNLVFKWLEDKLLSLLILLLISPLLLILAIGVKLSSPGPVFYRQERVSWNGRRFQMLKFRSMPVNNEQAGVQWGNAKNKQVTRFGKFIRATSLDELPQFINVLRGDMSIVGPRPERTVFVDQFKDEIPRYMQKHKMKAGITGWAQINGWRGDTDLEKRVEFDMYYIENWSLLFDIKIIFLTVFKGFIAKNAY